MRKSAYKNEESRLRRAVVNDTKNTDFDETTFSSTVQADEKLDALGIRKRELEVGLSEVNGSLQRAKAQAFHNGTYMKPKNWKALQDKQVFLKKAILEVDKQIKHAKSARRSLIKSNEEERVGTFDYTFRMMAKQLLAGPVYDRILTATIHRAEEEQTAPKP